jgi:RNA polymerase sigma-70 factor (ECF subfamily)
MNRAADQRHTHDEAFMQKVGVDSSTATLEASRLVAARAGDGSEFAQLIERYRPELQLHCYRIVGSLEEAEDLVQDTFLRAWSKRQSFQNRSTVRAWLYGIATHACLDLLRRSKRRLLPPEVAGPADPAASPLPPLDVPWLEPYPERLLDVVAANDDGPDAALIARETTELAFLAAIQHLPPRQRAVLILRDVLEWSAAETAASLATTTASVNSALQRAHATLARRLPDRDAGWLAGSATSETEQSLLGRLMDAFEQRDSEGVAAVLSADARMTMPPTPSWYDGREAIATFFAEHVFGPGGPGPVRTVATAANRQPAFAIYHRRPGESKHDLFALCLLRLERGLIAEITLFRLPGVFAKFGLADAI